ncbi:putative Regulator of nonsense transcripts 1 like protein [Blattamonas nauphoetae]|uniref:Regulator of nonsense transcripts 1 like protein n=1 Tax=Blattamonas nauphoetae TaxID=2049346 RepID=A0ABQ9XT68_9EUKA|nr:putative Regulator of nonsense transcripts 1 like protein [Blattamonas nauphoetae]
MNSKTRKGSSPSSTSPPPSAPSQWTYMNKQGRTRQTSPPPLTAPYQQIDQRTFPSLDPNAPALAEPEYGYGNEYDQAVPQCSYCGVKSPDCLVQCKVCNRWFCNGKGNSTSSHILIHLVRSKHKQLGFHPESQFTDTPIECYNCHGTNAFNIGYVFSNQEEMIMLVCRDPCVTTTKDSQWDLSHWEPIISERAIVPILVSPPTGEEEQLCKAVKFKRIMQLEDIWNEDQQPGKDGDDLEILEKESRPVPLRFITDERRSTGGKIIKGDVSSAEAEYFTVFHSLVQLEAEWDKRVTEQTTRTGVTIAWKLGIRGRHQGSFYFMRDDSDFRMTPGDRVRITREATQLQCQVITSKFDEVTVEVLESRSFDRNIVQGYTISKEWNGIPFTRMANGLRIFTDHPTRISKFLRHLILGDKDMVQLNSFIFSPTKLMEMAEVANEINPPESTLNSSAPATIFPLSTPAIVELFDGPLRYTEAAAIAEHSAYENIGFQIPALPDSISAPGLPGLNAIQLSAAKTALKQPFTLIQGPPGTGKTITSATLVYMMAQNARKIEEKNAGKTKKYLSTFPHQLPESAPKLKVLVCAPSNVAVDHLCDKLIKTKLRVVRMVAKSREEISTNVEKCTLHYSISQLTTPTAMRYKKLQELRAETGELSRHDQDEMYRLRERLEQSILDFADVVCCTCSTCGDGRLEPYAFPFVLVDEATQAVEPDCLLTLIKGARQVVLVGDQSQLGPITRCKTTTKNGFGLSLFERLILLGIQPTRLEIQYRMHPSLSQFPSEMFYDGALQNGVSEADRQFPLLKGKHHFTFPNPSHPMFFWVSTAPEEQSSSGTSFLNRQEAQMVEAIVTRLLNCGVNPANIGVISPYLGQCGYIPSVFHFVGKFGRDPERDKTLPDPPDDPYLQVEIASIDAFQGREKDFIILSCVRSNEAGGIGFLGDPRRLNVAITRARYGLIIIGNPHVLSVDMMWNRLLSHFITKNCVVEGELDRLRPSSITLQPPLHDVTISHYTPTEMDDDQMDKRGRLRQERPGLIEMVDRMIQNAGLTDVWAADKKKKKKERRGDRKADTGGVENLHSLDLNDTFTNLAPPLLPAFGADSFFSYNVDHPLSPPNPTQAPLSPSFGAPQFAFGSTFDMDNGDQSIFGATQ